MTLSGVFLFVALCVCKRGRQSYGFACHLIGWQHTARLPMSLLETAPALWDPKKECIYTFMVPNECGVLVSAWGRLTLEEMVAAGEVSPESRILPQDEAFTLSDAADVKRHCHGAQPIDGDRFDDLLNCLPPQRWVRQEGAESFRVSEAITGNIYTFCVRIGDSFFTINADGRTSHNELISLCSEVLK